MAPLHGQRLVVDLEKTNEMKDSKSIVYAVHAVHEDETVIAGASPWTALLSALGGRVYVLLSKRDPNEVDLLQNLKKYPFLRSHQFVYLKKAKIQNAEQIIEQVTYHFIGSNLSFLVRKTMIMGRVNLLQVVVKHLPVRDGLLLVLFRRLVVGPLAIVPTR
jgi:hypothetical protein